MRYDDADGAPVEEVAKLAPDLILATNSGITEKEYTKLCKIAPVVAYPEAPWITPWQTSLDMVGQALGRSTLADEVEAETQAAIDDAKEEYPEIQGKSLIFAYLTPDRPLDHRRLLAAGPAGLAHERLRAGQRARRREVDRGGAVLRHGLRRARRRPWSPTSC